MTRSEALRAALAAEGEAALVTLSEVRGSAPQETGAWMVVRPSGLFNGTIGGGALEWEALAMARAALAGGGGGTERRRFALGPQLGQCCGGQATVDIRRVAGESLPPDLDREAASAQTPVLLFGAGHVGRALALALAPLPFALRWIDPRPGAFPAATPAKATCVNAREPAREIDHARSGSFAIVMTHSHSLDLDIVARALPKPEIACVMLIGSLTKRAKFERRLAAIGMSPETVERLVCPIGVAGVRGKEPAIIAAATAAQLLLLRQERLQKHEAGNG